MTVDALTEGSKGKLFSSVNDRDTLEGLAQRVVGGDLHGQRVVEDDMTRLELRNVLGEQVNQCLHSLGDVVDLAILVECTIL